MNGELKCGKYAVIAKSYNWHRSIQVELRTISLGLLPHHNRGFFIAKSPKDIVGSSTQIDQCKLHEFVITIHLSLIPYCIPQAHSIFQSSNQRKPCARSIKVTDVGSWDCESCFHFLVQVDPTYRSLIEESSVDYIQKFRDLASKMNHQK